MTAYNIIKSLRKRGNVVLGSGCYSAALETRNQNVIIKVGTTTSDPWLAYYAQILVHYKHNAAAPKVHSMYIDVDNNYFVCTMERLTHKPAHSNIVDACKEYIQGWITDSDVIDILSEQAPGSDAAHVLQLLNAIKERTDYVSRDYYDSDDVDSNARMLDLHEGNIMWRGDQLVIIDPWCEVYIDETQDVSEWLENTKV